MSAIDKTKELKYIEQTFKRVELGKIPFEQAVDEITENPSKPKPKPKL